MKKTLQLQLRNLTNHELIEVIVTEKVELIDSGCDCMVCIMNAVGEWARDKAEEHDKHKDDYDDKELYGYIVTQPGSAIYQEKETIH